MTLPSNRSENYQFYVLNDANFSPSLFSLRSGILQYMFGWCSSLATAMLVAVGERSHPSRKCAAEKKKKKQKLHTKPNVCFINITECALVKRLIWWVHKAYSGIICICVWYDFSAPPNEWRFIAVIVHTNATQNGIIVLRLVCTLNA